MNQPVRIAPGGIIDVMRYDAWPVCGTASVLAPIAYTAASGGAYLYPLKSGGWSAAQKEIQSCTGCGARKEVFVNGRATCAYCKGEK